VRTTLEIPDALLFEAKAKAAAQGVSLARFITEAIGDKLRIDQKPWMKTIGSLSHLHEENVRIQKLIDEEFGKIDPEEWI